MQIAHIRSCNIVKHLCPQRIGLEEREGTDLEAQSQQFLVEETLPIQDICALIFHHIRHAVIMRVQNPGNCSIQIKRGQRLYKSTQKFLFPDDLALDTRLRIVECDRHKIRLSVCGTKRLIRSLQLCRRDQVHQYLSGLCRLAHQKMAQIAFMCIFMEITDIFQCKIIQRRRQDLAEIRIYDPAIRNRNDIIKAAAFMHAQRQFAILTRVAERKLHLVAVAELSGACHDPLEHRIKISACLTDHRSQQFPDLFLLQGQLIFIAQMLISAAAACAEMHARHIRPGQLHRRRLQHFQ